MAYEWDWAGAKAALERALALDPDDVMVRTVNAWYMCWVEGRTEDAVVYARRTLEQDPLSLDLNTRLGMFLYHAREYDEAIAVLRRVLERDPTYSDAVVWLGFALGAAGLVDEIEALPSPQPVGLLMGLIRAGRPEQARR